MFVLHILASESHSLIPGTTCVVGHRVIDEDGPLLAHGQTFIPGLEVDAGFEQGANFFLEVTRVRCRTNVVEVYFTWCNVKDLEFAKKQLKRFGYQVVDSADAVLPILDLFSRH